MNADEHSGVDGALGSGGDVAAQRQIPVEGDEHVMLVASPASTPKPPHTALQLVFTQLASFEKLSLKPLAESERLLQSPEPVHASSVGMSYWTQRSSAQHESTRDWQLFATHCPHADVASPAKRHVEDRSLGGHASTSAANGANAKSARTRGSHAEPADALADVALVLLATALR
jgi:hypothetical protein